MSNPVIIGDCTLYCGDSKDIISQIDNVDAVVTDPPYGYGYKPNAKVSINSALCKRNFSKKDQIIGDTGDMDFDPRPFLDIGHYHIWWGGNCYADKLPNMKSWLVWFKADGNTKIDQGHAELAWSNLGFAIRGFNHRWYGMVRDSEHGVKNFHPTQKPIEVMKWCLSYIPKDANTILDPFMGSGTTGVACAMMGRKFIGVELDQKYFDIACQRIEKAYQQPDLFVEQPKPEQKVMEILEE